MLVHPNEGTDAGCKFAHRRGYHMHGTMINEPNDISTQLYFGIYMCSPVVILADQVLIKCRITRALDRTGRS